jgi:prolyl 4-hydroxylase
VRRLNALRPAGAQPLSLALGAASGAWPDDADPFSTLSRMSAATDATSTIHAAADGGALFLLGNRVRARLAAAPSARRIATDRAEIHTVADFVSPDECETIMAMIDAAARPSSTYDLDDAVQYRTSWSSDFDPDDPVIRALDDRLCDLVGIDPRWGETLQGQRYAPGQQFLAHYDWFDTEAPYWPDEARRGGQRSWTVMAYLNDVARGGATEFPRIGISVEPRAGALLVWNNALPDGSPNPDVEHAALPVVSGVKYVLTKWFRTRPWQ